MAKKNTDNPVELEKEAQNQAEVMSHRLSEASAEEAGGNPDEEAEKAIDVEHAADTDEVTPAEVAAIHMVSDEQAGVTDHGPTQLEMEGAIEHELLEAAASETLKPLSKLEQKKQDKATRKAAHQAHHKATQKEIATAKPSKHSKRFLAAKEQVEAGKLYPLAEAIALAQKLSSSKFDGAIELHLGISKKKTKGNSESTRGVLNLPHGSGKSKKIIVLDEAKIEEIAKTKKINFDVAIALPALMPKVAKIARILGPKGKMPDPKAGTVTDNPEKAIEEINSGKVEYRYDDGNNIHQIIGRVSWESGKLIENAQVVLGIVPKSRLTSVVVAASIGPAVKVDTASLK